MNNVYEAPQSNLNISGENNSGQGKVEELPEGIKGWSWGAFLLNWIWAIGNKSWIGLFALLPYVGLIMAIILGIKGRQWAWQNKKWESVEHFQKTQKKWSFWAVLLTLGMITLGILAALAIPSYQDYVTSVSS